MKRVVLATLGMVAASVSSGALATGIGGDANGYNVFIFGTGMFNSQNTDTMGNLAAGGNVMLLNYSVAAGIAGNPAASPNPARLVVGGTLTASNGGVGQGQNGTIYTNNTPSLTSFTASGGTKALAQSGVSSFSNDTSVYTNLSNSLGALANTGTVSLNTTSDTLTLTGTSSGLNVFDLTAAQFNASQTQTIDINAPTGSTVLINVAGTTDAFNGNGQVNETGVTAANVLYNFFQATTVNLSSKDPEGSVLAPLAGVIGENGQFHGQLVAGSYGGPSASDGTDTTQFDNVQFTGNLPSAVPLPPGVWLLLSALACLGTVFRRGRTVQGLGLPA